MKRVARISCDVGVLKIEYASWIKKKNRQLVPSKTRRRVCGWNSGVKKVKYEMF